ncbi:tetratricopeptide repeat protein, partial [Natrinema thermotolerans]
MANDSISKEDVSQVIQDVGEFQKYAFLIGAGTSKPAGIPTSGELIQKWKEQRYEEVDRDRDFEEWVKGVEDEEIEDEKSEYGFWFEDRNPMRVHRREFIQELVKDADPTLSHLLLATMMSEGYVPHVLTPNFDDLLFDAFYLYLEDKPNLIDHRTVAPEFKLIRDDPTIVKLHGDYLYDNLKNTDSETADLEPAMEEVLQRTVSEYGLVVVGYGGGDMSIMEPLLDADLSEYGIYWCVLSSENLDPKVEELLEQPNTHLVEIDGFGSLMAKFEEELPGVELPAPEDIIDRAEIRANKLRGTLAESEEGATDEEEKLVDRTEKRWKAVQAIRNDEYSKAIELVNEVISSNSEDAMAYTVRGLAKESVDGYEDAIEDYNKAIDLDSENATAYVSRGNAKRELDRYEVAIEDYDEAIDLDPENVTAHVGRGNAKQALERYEEAIEDYDEVIDLDPEHATAYYNRGNAKRALERYEDAIEDYDKAIDLEPDDVESDLTNRGNAKRMLERYEDAIEDYDEAIDHDPEHATAYLNRGITKVALDRNEDAIED